jgi:hypothetical protein
VKSDLQRRSVILKALLLAATGAMLLLAGTVSAIDVRPQVVRPPMPQVERPPMPGITDVIQVLQVTAPPQGSQHRVDRNLPIRWTHSLIQTYPTVNIHLLDKPDGSVTHTIAFAAPNSGAFEGWRFPQELVWPGNTQVVRVETPDGRFRGYSGVFSFVNPPVAKETTRTIPGAIQNGVGYELHTYPGSDANDCLSVPVLQAGRPANAGEAKTGHYVGSGKHGNCSWMQSHYLRSQVRFDLTFLRGKPIESAVLELRMSDSITRSPQGTLATNEEMSSQTDIHVLDASWPPSPQPLINFYPGKFLTSFYLFGPSETAKIELLDTVRGWAAGQPNHGLMLRGPVNRSTYAESVNVRYYDNVRLVVTYLE